MLSRPWWLRRPSAAATEKWISQGSCPRCGSVGHVPIYYGLMSKEFRDAHAGGFIERHRAPDGRKPDRHCDICGFDFLIREEDATRVTGS